MHDDRRAIWWPGYPWRSLVDRVTNLASERQSCSTSNPSRRSSPSWAITPYWVHESHLGLTSPTRFGVFFFCCPHPAPWSMGCWGQWRSITRAPTKQSFWSMYRTRSLRTLHNTLPIRVALWTPSCNQWPSSPRWPQSTDSIAYYSYCQPSTKTDWIGNEISCSQHYPWWSPHWWRNPPRSSTIVMSYQSAPRWGRWSAPRRCIGSNSIESWRPRNQVDSSYRYAVEQTWSTHWRGYRWKIVEIWI